MKIVRQLNSIDSMLRKAHKLQRRIVKTLMGKWYVYCTAAHGDCQIEWLFHCSTTCSIFLFMNVKQIQSLSVEEKGNN